MSDTVVTQSTSGEYWRVTVGTHVEFYDHEPTGADLTQLRQSIAVARLRAANAKLMQVKSREGKIEGAFSVTRA